MGVDLLPLKQWAIYNIQRVNRPLVMAIQNHSSLIIIPVVKKTMTFFLIYQMLVMFGDDYKQANN